MQQKTLIPGRARLDEEAVRRLREHALTLQESGGGPVPHRALLSLAADAPQESRVTVDFPGGSGPSVPVVIVQCPPEGGSADSLASLSSRERAVASLIADGLANKQIAARLGITLLTVKDHVH